jgi:hypothetical protein
MPEISRFYRVTSFEIVGPFVLKVGFDDHTARVIDFRPVLEGEMYGSLKDRSTFNQVRLDSEVGTLVWPNGADFDPATLHDWPDYQVEMTDRAKGWADEWTRERQVLSVAEARTDYGKNGGKGNTAGRGS